MDRLGVQSVLIVVGYTSVSKRTWLAGQFQLSIIFQAPSLQNSFGEIHGNSVAILAEG